MEIKNVEITSVKIISVKITSATVVPLACEQHDKRTALIADGIVAADLPEEQVQGRLLSHHHEAEDWEAQHADPLRLSKQGKYMPGDKSLS